MQPSDKEQALSVAREICTASGWLDDEEPDAPGIGFLTDEEIEQMAADVSKLANKAGHAARLELVRSQRMERQVLSMRTPLGDALLSGSDTGRGRAP